MKIFISSLITGMETIRAAAREAVLQLGHEPVMAEEFSAKAHSPQIACLEGIRQSGLVVLLLGSGYGEQQSSGLSATHEEYREAKGIRPVIAFVQEGVTPEAAQRAFIEEVQGWEGGLFRGSFRQPETLKVDVTRAIHEWQLSTAASPLDTEGLLRQAITSADVQQDGHRYGFPTLALAVVGGPNQAILRPSEIENTELANTLLQQALFGKHAIFKTEDGNQSSIDGDSLLIQQKQGNRSLKLDPRGGLLFRLSQETDGMGMIVIKERLERQIADALGYSAWVLDHIDPTQRLKHIAIAATMPDSDNMIIRSQAEHDASPNSYSMGIGKRDTQPVHPTPGHRPRAALSHEAEHLAQDLVTLLRRKSGNAAGYE